MTDRLHTPVEEPPSEPDFGDDAPAPQAPSQGELDLAPDASRALAGEGVDVGLEAVIGSEDRRRITSTTAAPWKRICSLEITARDGSAWSGTGWLAGERLLVTAGHNVFLHDHGGFASKVVVIAGRDGPLRPLESTATRMLSVEGWTEQQAAEADYGALLLARPLGETNGYFGFANLSDNTLANGQLNVAGYPDDLLPPGSLWHDSGPLHHPSAAFLTYQMDTGKSQSGSPIWRKVGAKRRVVGIHTGGSSAANRGVRIHQAVFDRILAWRQLQ